jgi:hypothetical protein
MMKKKKGIKKMLELINDMGWWFMLAIIITYILWSIK